MNSSNFYRITNVELCKLANEKSEKHIYRVLPYVAPEDLRGKEYTQAIVIYSIGIIINDVFNGFSPYYDMAHYELLAIKTCQRLRPKFIIKVSQVIEDIFIQCVVADPLKRPTPEYLKKYLIDCIVKFVNFSKKQMNSIKNNHLLQIHQVIILSLTIYSSRLLRFNNLPEPKNDY